jgi:hypothetical protein
MDDDETLDMIADDLTDAALRADPAPRVPPTPPVPVIPLVSDEDRDRLEQFIEHRAHEYPVEAAAICNLLDGCDLGSDERSVLALFATLRHRQFPEACEAIAHALDGGP